jgi:hypothetical protein
MPVGDPGDDSAEGIDRIAPRDGDRASHRAFSSRCRNCDKPFSRRCRPRFEVESREAASARNEKAADNRAAGP